ncbi:probable inactive protein kinase DDB_G0270444 [Helianthus annuus]|uniref:probable inactive protein kinase DDB_G0270444 n=1 Tax=Helianthus annuus TaxID=4232 RepID=UPI000B9031F4|nr:probable inactive protein kinase DDB_G0270444 [Helianthus annuus]
MEITGKQSLGGASTKLGFDKSKILPEEDRVLTAHGRKALKNQHCVLGAEIKDENKEEKAIAEIKEKTREEILSEKTDREIRIARNRIDEMQQEYEKAVSYKRWDKKQECYVNGDGEQVVPKKEIVFDDVLLKKDEERVKKNVEEMVNNMKKAAGEVKTEVVEVEIVKDEAVKVENVKIHEEDKVKEVEKAVTEEQQVVEDEEKTESLTEVKIETLKSASDKGTGDEKKEELKQTEAAENTEVLNEIKDYENGSWSSLTQRDEEVAESCVG